MIKFITYRENVNGELLYFILQKEFPHYVGRIVTYPVDEALINSPVPNHNLWVTFGGVLQGNFLPSYKDVMVEIEAIYANMANWFYTDRIMIDEKKYKKFKINK